MSGKERNCYSGEVRFEMISLEARPNSRSGGYNSPNAARAWAYLTSITVRALYVLTLRYLSDN